MIWIIIIVIAVIAVIAFNLGSTSGQVIGSVNNSGGMRVKYAKLLNNILSGHKDSKIFVETRTYIKAGVSNYGGTTFFHIQQSTGNKVIIQYEIKDNPAVPSFQMTCEKHLPLERSIPECRGQNRLSLLCVAQSSFPRQYYTILTDFPSVPNADFLMRGISQESSFMQPPSRPRPA